MSSACIVGCSWALQSSPTLSRRIVKLHLACDIQISWAFFGSLLDGAYISLRLLVGGTLSHHRRQMLLLCLWVRLSVWQTWDVRVLQLPIL